MNSELVKQAMDRLINPNILVNLVSRRVRQLSTGGGGMSRPLIESEKPLGAADTALEEIIQEKIDFENVKEGED
ncbi:MAG: DNA-directed RNA polymerase subunit omega [Verrucomicrobiota bacterium]